MIIIGNYIGRRGGVDPLRVYWNSLISAVIDDATPTYIDLTFPAMESLTKDDFYVTVDGVGRLIDSYSWSGGRITLVLVSEVDYGQIVKVKLRDYEEKTATNNVLYNWKLTSTGTGAGVSTLKLEVSANIAITLTGNAKFYTNSGGTENESDTWNITSGAIRTMYLKCPSDTAKMKFSDSSKLIKLSDWTSSTNAASLAFSISTLPSGMTYFYCGGSNTISGSIVLLPSGMTYFLCTGSNTVSGNIASLPSGLTYFYCGGSNTISGSIVLLPSGMTYFYCTGSNTVSGSIASLPSGMTYFLCTGSNTVNSYTSPRAWAANVNRIHCNASTSAVPQADLTGLIIDLSATTWIDAKALVMSGGNASMADTTQGGIWGDFSGGTPDPSDVAVALKTLVKTKSVTCTFNGISMPGATGDGSGFPENFGDWWRS